MRLVDEANRLFDALEKSLAVALADGVAGDHGHYKFVVGQIDGIRKARGLMTDAAKSLDSDAADGEDAAPAVMTDSKQREVKRRGYGDY